MVKELMKDSCGGDLDVVNISAEVGGDFCCNACTPRDIQAHHCLCLASSLLDMICVIVGSLDGDKWYSTGMAMA